MTCEGFIGSSSKNVPIRIAIIGMRYVVNEANNALVLWVNK